MSNNEEIEINLVEMFRVIFRRFGSCVISGIVFAIIIGGFMAFRQYRTIHSEEGLAMLNAKNEEAMYEYETTKESLENEIELLQSKIPSQQKYIDNSMLMTFDPYNVGVSRYEYMVDTHYQINPEMTYQNKDKTDTLVSLYSLSLSSNEFYEYLVKKMNLNIEPTYVNEFITFRNLGNGLFSIEVKYATQAEAEQISKYIDSYLLNKVDTFNQTATHDFSLYSSTSYSEVEEWLVNHQQGKIDGLKNMENQLKEDKFNLVLLEEDKPDLKDVDEISVVKKLIIFGVIGFFVGGVLLGMLYAFGYLFNTTVTSEKEFYDRYHIRVFGSMNVK